MNTSKWIVTFAGVALVAGVALAGAPHNHETASKDGHQMMGMSCGMAMKDMESCPMHAAKAEAQPMGCCHKAAAETADCPMHAKSEAAAPSCHGDHATEAPAADASAHAGHH